MANLSWSCNSILGIVHSWKLTRFDFYLTWVTFLQLFFTVDFGKISRESLQWLERGSYLLCPNIQVFPQFRLLCWRDDQIQEETKNPSMVQESLFYPFPPPEYYQSGWLEQWFFTRSSLNFRCDRILWLGDGIEQLAYIRGESRFSDHRPVCGVFSVEVERRSKNSRFRKGYSYAATRMDYVDCIPQRHSFYEFW